MKTARQRRAGRLVAVAGVLVLVLASCEREQHELRAGPSARAISPQNAMTELQPGPQCEQTKLVNPYEGNLPAINEGRLKYAWFNCIGCHAAGGGGMGPALMDDKWIYGGDAADIYNSIMEGRPKGMPSFRGRIPEEDVWKIVAYVRSLSKLDAQLPEGTKNLPLQDKASGNLDKGAKELKEYQKEAMDE